MYVRRLRKRANALQDSVMPVAADLERFVAAQDSGGSYKQALAELHAGRKRSHWIWYVFPQVQGLGMSPTSQHFGIAGLDEARAYLAHPVLGPRLLECAQTLLDHGASDPVTIFGALDAMKVRSSMTLFAQADPDQPVFSAVLDRYFGGEADPATVERL
jgi:uncharacterized protein (DUF1810 family)